MDRTSFQQEGRSYETRWLRERLQVSVPFRFARRRLDQFEPELTAIARELVERFVRRVRCEFVEELALPMVVRSLAATLGRPQQEADLWASWGPNNVYAEGDGRLGPNPGLERYLADVIDAAHRSPGDDLFGRLARAEVDGRSLTRDELMGFGHLVLAAGRGTLVDAITGSVWYLAGHPDERARLARQPELLPVAVEEFLRHLSPLAHIGRWARADTAVGSCPIPRDTLVSLGFAFANHDPAAFEDPDRCVIDRRPNRHLAFGHGPHTCIGAHLARLELRVLLRELLAIAPSFHLAGAGRLSGPGPRVHPHRGGIRGAAPGGGRWVTRAGPASSGPGATRTGGASRRCPRSSSSTTPTQRSHGPSRHHCRR
jgi:cytochrome P450